MTGAERLRLAELVRQDGYIDIALVDPIEDWASLVLDRVLDALDRGGYVTMRRGRAQDDAPDPSSA